MNFNKFYCIDWSIIWFLFISPALFKIFSLKLLKSLLSLLSLSLSSSSSKLSNSSQLSLFVSKKLCKIIQHSVNWTAVEIFLTFNSFKLLNLFLNLPNAFSTTTQCKEWVMLNCVCKLFSGLIKGLIRKLDKG